MSIILEQAVAVISLLFGVKDLLLEIEHAHITKAVTFKLASEIGGKYCGIANKSANKIYILQTIMAPSGMQFLPIILVRGMWQYT